MNTKENRTPVHKRTVQRADAPRKRSSTATPKRTGRAATNRYPVSAKRTEQVRAVAAKSAVKRKQQRFIRKQITPEVVYTQPGPFNRNRFLLHLATVVAAVLALVFGISIFFKVDSVTVIGNNKYASWEILESSGIQIGDNLLGINEARITSNIIGGLPYVDSVRVGIKLPNTVKIEIVELDVVYAVESDDGSWWLMRADGGIVEKTNSADAELYTKVLGVQITGPEVGQIATAAQPVPQETDASGQTVPVTVRAAEQLDAAISILQYLEDCGVLGEAASVNVADLSDLELWYGERYQVTIGDATQLGYKISSMKAAIDQMGDYQSGVLDISFTTWPNEVGYTPFD